MRRIVSIILSMLMIVSMCTFVSFGASAEELVLPTEPTLEELTNKDGYTPLTLDMIFTEGRQGVELKKDFDMAGKYYLAENITLPQTIDGTFTGELHGNGKTITVTTGPVFSSINGATISNVKLATDADGISVATADHIAILAAIGGEVTVENVITEGIVKNTSATSVTASAAGLIGMLSSENESTLINCYNKAAVTGMNADPQGTAGIVGHVAAGQLNLIDCVNIGAIIGENDAAGIVCYAKAFVDAENCINAGKVVANNDAAGGIMAHTTKGFDIDYCLNIGSASGMSTAGIVANMGGAPSENRSITNCWNDTDITGKTYVAGIVGYFNTANSLYIGDCYNTGTITATGASGGAMGAAGICCYSGSDVVIENCTNEGDAIVANNGTRQAAGILGYANNSATIRNCVNTGDCSVSNTSTATMAAGMLAYVVRTNNPVILIENCMNSGNMTTGQHAGGILAFVQGISSGAGPISVEVVNCVNSGDVSVADTAHSSGGDLGGIVGQIAGTKETMSIRYCMNTGEINANNKDKFRAGGIAGYMGTLNAAVGTASDWIYQEIVACQNTGDVTATTIAGGIMAQTTGSGGSYRGPRIIYSGSAGNIKSTGNDYVGGILGYANVTVIDFHDNFFIGTVDANNAKAYVFTAQGQTALKDDRTVASAIVDNYYIASDAIVNVAAVNEGKTLVPATDVPAEYKLTPADVASGKLAYLMQEATGADKTVWGQNIGTDAAPVLFGDKVVKLGEEYVNVFFDERNVVLNQGYKYVVVAKAPENAQVTFTFNGETVEAVGEATDRAGYYKFVFDGVAPQFIANDITTNLYVGANLVETVTESILDYCEALYAELGEGPTKTLVEKVYLYGVAARDYVVAKELYTAEELPAVSSDKITATLGAAPEAAELEVGVIGTGASFVGANVVFDSTNKVIIKVELDEGVDISNVTINGNPITSAPDANGVYSFVTESVYASQFNSHRLYNLEVNGVVVAELVYNVCTYASRMANNESASAEMKALAIATYEYGVAASNSLK